MVAQMIDELRSWGCDTVGALERMLGDENLYFELLHEYIPKIDMERLDNLIASKNKEEAFQYVHDLKGTLGSLGLTPLYVPVCKMTDNVRAGSFEVDELMSNFKVAKHQLDNILYGI